MRKNFIDNLRWADILLLFPYHVFTMYNNWGENYYVRGPEVATLSRFVKFCQPWFMPLLFVLAGASTVYALKKRTPKQYLAERCRKLLIPLVAGLLLVVPVLTYFAERFHNGYQGGYLQQYLLFFTKTDLVGYTGGFTPAHLWFLLYLFAVSLLALPLLLAWRRCPWRERAGQLPVWAVSLLFLVVWAMSYVLDINGKSIGRYFALFVLGAVVLSWDGVQERLEKRRWPLTAVWLVLSVLRLSIQLPGLLDDGLTHCVSWMGILALMGLAKRYFNGTSRVGEYFSRASFPIYIFHLPWMIAIAFYVFPLTASIPLQVMACVAGSFIASVLCYELVRRFRVTRFLFAARK